MWWSSTPSISPSLFVCPHTWEDNKNMGSKNYGAIMMKQEAFCLCRVITRKTKIKVQNKKCWGIGRVWCRFPSATFPLYSIQWKRSINGKYLGKWCQSSILYILWMKCIGNLVNSVIVYIHYKQSVLFGKKILPLWVDSCSCCWDHSISWL